MSPYMRKVLIYVYFIEHMNRAHEKSTKNDK